MSLYELTIPTISGSEESLSLYKNQVLLVVNTASGCGFTPQFSGLQTLYETFKDKGFTILGFPCNQFGNQEPLSSVEAAQSCQLNFGVTFPMFAKINVNGENAHPLFTYLKKQTKGFLGEDIKWNFTKFLINRNGDVVHRFAPTTEPKDIAKYIEALL